ncbi:MAG: UPF0175 family protein [Spirosomaceae bacterium]|nr:UPF0175 family protein [Spirosomataceae bacterium]
MVIEIPDDVLQKDSYDKIALLTDIAVMLYERGHLSLGRAAAFAQCNRFRFQAILADRNIPIHYDLDIDLESLRGLDSAL